MPCSHSLCALPRGGRAVQRRVPRGRRGGVVRRGPRPRSSRIASHTKTLSGAARQRRARASAPERQQPRAACAQLRGCFWMIAVDGSNQSRAKPALTSSARPLVTAPRGTHVTADHRVVLADDEPVGIVSPALPGHVGVASPGGRPELDDGAKCAATHDQHNNPLMKIIPVSVWAGPRGHQGFAEAGSRVTDPRTMDGDRCWRTCPAVLARSRCLAIPPAASATSSPTAGSCSPGTPW